MKKEISERFLLFSSKIIRLGKLMNNTYDRRHVYGQLFRSGTSSGANYEESHSAQSKKDFIHKREVALKELRESYYWLQLINKSQLIKPTDPTLIYLLQENKELLKILAKSIATIKSKKEK